MTLSRTIRVKEATKTALAMMLVYGIALNSGWMNPYWAAVAVAMISLSTEGQSIHKGLLRIAGTIPGCLSALIIMSLAQQSRWLFITLVAAWVFFTTYLKIVDKKRSYMWFVAGFVCLIIVLSGPSSSENIFQHAVYRGLETVMGVVVYTMISVFLWPQNNAGAIKKASLNLAATQWRLISGGRAVMSGKAHLGDFAKLRTQEFQQLDQLSQALLAEGSENYEVYELRHMWARFHSLSNSLKETIDRWGSGISQLSAVDVETVIPDLPAFYDELEVRFDHIRQILNGVNSSYEMKSVLMPVDLKAVKRLSAFDRAALAMAKKDLESIEVLTRSLLECVQVLTGNSFNSAKAWSISARTPARKGFTLPVIDPDHVRGAAFVAIVVFCGFLVWILFNPPGHASWFELPGIMAMAVAATQQLKVTIMAKPIFLASVLCLIAYVFIMPRLASFYGLGSLIFVLVFINCYLFTGMARLAGMVAIFTQIAVQNQQTYNFAAMVNSLIFTIGAFFFVFGMSYLLSSSRPEKKLMKLSRRYFQSAEYLVRSVSAPVIKESGWWLQWRHAFHRYQIKTIPGKIIDWGRAIDQTLFPANSPQQTKALVTCLQVLSIRVEALLQSAEDTRTHVLIRKTADELKPWLAKIEATFAVWATHPESGAGSMEDLQSQLETALNGLEGRIDSILEQVDESSAIEVDGESFYRLLGGLRGITEASVTFAGVSGGIDWRQWGEEKFS